MGIMMFNPYDRMIFNPYNIIIVTHNIDPTILDPFYVIIFDP